MSGSTGAGRGTLVVVGSGPVGMTAALLLRERFDRVVVLERQSKESFLRTKGFTFPIVLAPAARRVLEQVGALDAIEQERSPYFGVVMHHRFLGRDTHWTVKRKDTWSHWRNHIVRSLHDRLEQVGIEVHFDAVVEQIDMASNTCIEATLGAIPFDLLLGADGVNSQTRALMGSVIENDEPRAYDAPLMDRWYAYRLPSDGPLDDRYGPDERGHALHVHIDNPPDFPDDKFRVITVAMTQPSREVSVVVKHDAGIDVARAKRINQSFFAELVAPDALEMAWDAGVGGEYRHVKAPAFAHGSVLLVGDAAHGFEGNGDLINLGVSSVAALPDLIDGHADIPEALAVYDATVGRALRVYADMAWKRSLEQLDFELMTYEIGALLGLNGHHPSLWGIYEEDFEPRSYMERYETTRRRVPVQLAVLAAGAGLAGLGLWRAWSATRRPPEGRR